jgi:hypothetical protein
MIAPFAELVRLSKTSIADFDAAVVVNKTQFPKFVHEKTYARSRRVTMLSSTISRCRSLAARQWRGDHHFAIR